MIMTFVPGSKMRISLPHLLPLLLLFLLALMLTMAQFKNGVVRRIQHVHSLLN